MATIYERNVKYSKEKGVEILSEQERAALGREIMDAFMRIKDPKKIIHYRKFEKDGQCVKVIDYPRDFTSVIDKYIDLFYLLK